MKRCRYPSSSEDSDNGSSSTSWSHHSKSQLGRNSSSRSGARKPSEVFRTDLITAMKLHDSFQLNPEDFYILGDPWRQEWEKGVQVPVSPQSIPRPVVRTVADKGKAIMFTRPKKPIRSSGSEPPVLGYVGIHTLAEGVCRYDLNEMDVSWLEILNEEFLEMGMQMLDELTMERVMEEFERRCYDNMNHAMETEEGLGIEYDEDVVCDVCQSPDGEDGNEMVFCDKCNICVHQACYGILKVPEGSWLCRICALGIVPKCLLCPKKGGAMKPTRSGTKWVHVSCALWIPEVSIGNPEKMEPVTNISHVPSSRWALLCCVCKEKSGACIQCSAKNCRTAFHVTCALHCGLEMNTFLTDADEVKFKSSCPKHSVREGARGRAPVLEEEGRGRDTDVPPGRSCVQEAQMVNLRKAKLQQLEDDFFKFVMVEEVARRLGLPEETVDFLFQYWKLKRKANFNRPLVTPKKDEEVNLAKREQDVLLRRLELFTHLRQDLERVRNLTYMVTRREKIKRSYCRLQEQIFLHHIQLLEQECQSGVPSTLRLEEALFFGWVSSHPLKPRPHQHSRERGVFQKSSDGPSTKPNLGEPHRRVSRGGRTTPRPAQAADLREGSSLRGGLRDRARPAKPAEEPPHGVPSPASGARSPRLAHTVPNGSLRRASCNQTNSLPLSKNWGSFKIPKKNEKLEGQDPGRHKLLDMSPTRGRTRSRLRAGTENHGHVPDSRLRDSETEAKGKRHHAQRLRGPAPITRRYGTETLPRGILAS